MTEQVYSEFSVGSVFSKTFSLMKTNIVSYLIFIIAMAIISASLSGVFLEYLGLRGGFFPTTFETSILGIYAISMIFTLLFYSFIGTVVIDSSLAALNNNPINIATHTSKAIRMLIPMAILYIVLYLLAVFGLMLLIIPGLIVITMFAVAIEAKVAEDLPIFKALSRSRQLTKGHRWAIFALILIPYLILVLLGFAVVGFNLSPDTAQIEELFSFQNQLISALYNSVYLVFNYVLFTVAYSQLVSSKEGGQVENVSDVFA